jgi:hypothetical protein
MAKAINAVRRWWFVFRCHSLERKLSTMRADREIRTLQQLRTGA